MATLSTAPLDLSAGIFIRCMSVDEHTTHIQVQFRQLRVITHDPVVLQPDLKMRPADVTDRDVELHSEVQRSMDGNKKSNIPTYARYIRRHVTGEKVGVLPPIHLWTERPLSIHEFADKGHLQRFLCVPHGWRLIAIDGETQLASHYDLQRDPSMPQDVKERHESAYLSAVVHDDRSSLQARQFFHDLNWLGVRVNSAIALSMDTTDPLMALVSSLSEDVPFLKGRVERISRQLKRNSPKVVKLQDLRQFVINIVHGISGVQYGTKPAPLDHVDLDELKSVAHDWLTAYTDAFGVEFADRDGCVTGMGSVLAAVGAMGKTLISAPVERRDECREDLLRTLKEVDWHKGDHWLGTALSKTPTGNYTANGPKQSAYAVHTALSDPESGAYQQIRHGRTSSEPVSA
ncbi:DNA sulfur modification protein DndB [Streptomyces rectiviolaceus]|uniref:DNA sulfur modification protein DndB n=1 Tax=Streptomyces rectiviolaceus TaxID=332591 RepID=UPI0031DDEC54